MCYDYDYALIMIHSGNNFIDCILGARDTEMMKVSFLS